MPKTFCIIGGGAAGFFGAIRIAERAQQLELNVQVILLENSPQVLKKVRISGGGRCNVTHNLFTVQDFVKNYPRGHKELISPFQKFQAADTVRWFADRGVILVAEEDGRMFPNTNSSETIIACLLDQVKTLGIDLRIQHPVQTVEKNVDAQFTIKIKDQAALRADAVLIATGSSAAGYEFAKSLGHTITPLAPSLFSFKIESPLLEDLAGLSFPNAKLKLSIPGAKHFKQDGPTLITHWGLSGPAILKLSAWAAREMMSSNYVADLSVNWLGIERIEAVQELIQNLKNNNTKSLVKNTPPPDLAKRFWIKLVEEAGVSSECLWADFSKKHLIKLSELLFNSQLKVTSKNRYKDEFVECGGVDLKEIDFKTLQSKVCPGLYFAGELLDVDGITGGFNFQNAWTTSWIAGTHMVESFSAG